MKVVKFIKIAGIYFPGDVAGFDDAIADKFIADGTAIDPNAPPAPKAVPASDAPRSRFVAVKGGKLNGNKFKKHDMLELTAAEAAELGDLVEPEPAETKPFVVVKPFEIDDETKFDEGETIELTAEEAVTYAEFIKPAEK